MGRRREINVVNNLLTSIHSKTSNDVTLNTTRKTLNRALYDKSNGVNFLNGSKIVGKAVTELQYNLISSSNSVDVNGSFAIELIISNINTNTRSDILTQYPYTIRGVDGSDVNNNLKGKFVPGTNMVINFTINENLIENKTFIISLDGYDVSATVSLNVIETYDLSAPIEVDEGDVITVDLSTQGVDIGAQVSYRIEGVSSSDISGASLTGSFTIDENGNAQKTFNVTEDALTEGSEVFTLTLDNNEDEVNVNIVDTSRLPSYNLSVNNSTVNETNNQIFIVTLVTENVNAGERIYYTMSGSGIEVNDFVGLTSLKGYFEVGTTDTITFTVKEDFISESNENILFSLDNNSDFISITIQDTSTPTYDLSAPIEVDEGDVITVNLATQGLSNGTIVPYRIEGISSSDISDASLTGNFTIGANGNAQKTFNVTEDRLSDGDKTFRLSIVGVNEYVDVTIIDTSKTPGFTLQSNIETVDETVPDNVVTITLITENTFLGEEFDYTISGDSITPDDFTGLASLNGTFTVDANGRDNVTLTINEDFITENNETLILALDNGQAQKSIIINDTSIETYDLTRNVASVDEGEDIIITLTTRGVIDNTSIPYIITGVSSNDIGGVNTSGNFIVVNNTATATFTTTEDLSPIEDGFKENVEIFTLTLDNIGETVSVDINDTSVQTFELIPDVLSVNEGDQVTITLNTQGLSDGNVVPYTISGDGITSDDFTGLDSLDGTFTVIDNTASVILNISNDITTEGTETFILSLVNGGASTDPITINDTSKTLPTYTFDALDTINEGEQLTITLNTTNVTSGTIITYTISGDGITAADLGLTELTGNFTISNNTASVTLDIANDETTEGIETFTITLDDVGTQTSKTITIQDTSSLESRSLSVLFLGVTEPFNVRTQDSSELITAAMYGEDPAALDNILDCDDYDVVVFNNFTWDSMPDRPLHLNLTTYDKLKDFVQRGGVIFDHTEHWSSQSYVNTPGSTSYISGTVSNIAYDLGGIIGDSNSDWKGLTTTSTIDSYPTQIALDNDVVDRILIDGVHPHHRTTYASYIQNLKSNGMPVIVAGAANHVLPDGYQLASIVHMWDGSINGHLNSGINGKIIICGESNWGLITSYFTSHVINPMFDYIARTKDTSTANWRQLGSDIDGEAAGDKSGEVSINATGDRVAIGAHQHDGINGIHSGHTRIYEYSGSGWIQLGSDIDGEAAEDYSGNRLSINAAGDRVAIGARLNDGINGIHSGHTRIYEYSGGSWIQLGSDIDGEAAEDYSGDSVSLNAAGDRVAIGATQTGSYDINSGYTRIYEYDGTNWIQLGSHIDGEAAGDKSGYSVSMNNAGNRVAIGSLDNSADAGHTRIYEYDDTNWVQLGLDIDGEAAGDNSGISVSLNAAGTRVAIGAFRDNINGIKSGNVRIYEYSGGSWVQLASDIGGEAAGDMSGSSVSMNDAGDRVAIGARFNDGINGINSGHTRIYEYSGGSWVQLACDIDGEAAGDYNGDSVSLNAAGDRVAIGARLNDGNGINSGHTRIYELS
tara:strand:- start:165 stop:4751 length:4587 start_codon:yes stop_codon:yes gene_type:complete